MKNTFLVAVALLLFVGLYAQNKNRVSVGLSYNKIEIAYRHSFAEKQIWVSPSFGVGNQDANSNFDDIITEVKIGIPIFTFQKSSIYAQLNSGLYFANNNYYKTVAPFVGLNCGYEILFGNKKMHSVFTEIGYLYGKSEYKQKYYNDYISVSSTEIFILPPLSLKIGYGLNF